MMALTAEVAEQLTGTLLGKDLDKSIVEFDVQQETPGQAQYAGEGIAAVEDGCCDAFRAESSNWTATSCADWHTAPHALLFV